MMGYLPWLWSDLGIDSYCISAKNDWLLPNQVLSKDMDEWTYELCTCSTTDPYTIKVQIIIFFKASTREPLSQSFPQQSPTRQLKVISWNGRKYLLIMPAKRRRTMNTLPKSSKRTKVQSRGPLPVTLLSGFLVCRAIHWIIICSLEGVSNSSVPGKRQNHTSSAHS